VGRRLAAAAGTALAATSRLAFTGLRRLTPATRVGLAAAAAVSLAWAVLPESDAVLEREVAGFIGRGDWAGARRRLDESARRRPGDPLVEKLRADLACARGEPAECIRRYRVALAKRPDLRDDRVVRANARRLLRPAEACGTRRAAATLVGELRDRDALPALEEARRSAGVFAWFCTGDSIDRAITATRAEIRR
jgi:eukaryotic-like serine/threonine-protein kinase